MIYTDTTLTIKKRTLIHIRVLLTRQKATFYFSTSRKKHTKTTVENIFLVTRRFCYAYKNLQHNRLNHLTSNYFQMIRSGFQVSILEAPTLIFLCSLLVNFQ